MTPSQALIKLDFANAFNSVRRDVILERTAALIPEAYPYIKAAYADSSFLGYEGEPIMSSEGVQQGDPLGPLLFCLAIRPLLTNIKCEFKMGYLDDITLGGELETVAKEVDILSKEAAHIGLTLRESKCELVTSTSLFSVPQPVKGYRRVPVTEAVMLGAPLMEGIAMDQIWDKHKTFLDRAASRLALLSAYDALVILKNSLSLPKLLFHLRCTFSGKHPTLAILDAQL